MDIEADLSAAQQSKHLTSPQADQSAHIGNTQPAGLHPQQHLEPNELLLAHRHRRHGASPATPEPAGVSPLSCRGVSSLYCGYSLQSPFGRYGKSGRRRSAGGPSVPRPRAKDRQALRLSVAGSAQRRWRGSGSWRGSRIALLCQHCESPACRPGSPWAAFCCPILSPFRASTIHAILRAWVYPSRSWSDRL